MVCVQSVFFFFFLFFVSSFFFLFLSLFSLTDANNSQDSRKGRGNHHFSCSQLPPAHDHSFIKSRFLPLLFNRSICNYQTDTWWDLFSLGICILSAFSLIQYSRSRSLHFKVTLWGFELTSNYHPSVTKPTP